MALSTWKDKFRVYDAAWSLEELVGVAGDVLGLLGIDEPSVPNDRLVRYYTGEGAMSKPGREGREARYTYRHLVELLVTRMLLKDGWPLSKVAQFIASSDPVSLEQMLPEENMTPAEREVRAIRRTLGRGEVHAARSTRSMRGIAEDEHSPRMSFKSPGFDEDALAVPEGVASRKMLELQGAMARGRSSLAQVMNDLGHGEHRPAWTETESLELTPWCTVTFDAESLRNLPQSAFEPLGEALVQSLRERRMTSKRERK